MRSNLHNRVGVFSDPTGSAWGQGTASRSALTHYLLDRRRAGTDKGKRLPEGKREPETCDSEEKAMASVRLGTDLRLVEIFLELEILKKHLSVIDQQIGRLVAMGEQNLHADLKKYAGDSDKLNELIAIFEWERDVMYPRMFRGPFLMSLYAVFESAVREVTLSMKNKKHAGIALDDLHGDFLERIRRYYRHVLKLDWLDNPPAWQEMVALTLTRHLFVNTNGRTDHLSKEEKDRLREMKGIEIHGDQLTVEAIFVEKAHAAVLHFLEEFIRRYKAWEEERFLM